MTEIAVAGLLDDGNLVRALRERSNANDSIVYAHRVYAETASLAARHGVGAPHSVLELGPGVNVGALFCFVASGVERAAGVDVAPLPDAPPGFYENLRDYLMSVEGFAWWRAWTAQFSNLASFPPIATYPESSAMLAKIDHRAGLTSHTLPFGEQEFDVVYSVAVLEHVVEPSSLLSEVRRVLKPGGVGIHEIDLKHHGSLDPLKFLEWGDVEWRALTRPYGIDVSLGGILSGGFIGEIFCNRLRQPDWVHAFVTAGFSIEAVEPLVVLNAVEVRPERFTPHFRHYSLEDLRTLAVRVVVRRPFD